MNKNKIVLKELRSLIKQIIKEEISPKTILKHHLIDLIDFSEYDEDDININVSGENKIKELFNLFKLEKGYELKLGISLKKSLEDWLRGLPSAIDLPIYTNDIENLLFSIGIIDDRDMDEQYIQDLFYKTIVDIIIETSI